MCLILILVNGAVVAFVKTASMLPLCLCITLPTEGAYGRVCFSSLFLLPLRNVLCITCASQKPFSDGLRQIQMPLHEVLRAVCKTRSCEITAGVFAAAFRWSIFDMEANIRPWILSGQGVTSENIISAFSLLTTYLCPSWDLGWLHDSAAI